MKIWIDVDDTLWGLNDFIAECLDALGWKMETITSYDEPWQFMKPISTSPFLERLGLTTPQELFWWLVNQATETMDRNPEVLKPYPQAVELTRKLYEKYYHIIFNTGRPRGTEGERVKVEEWLRYWNFPHPACLMLQNPKEKQVGYRDLYGNIAVIVDDNPNVQRAALEYGCPVFSLDKPWSGEFPDSVKVAQNWEELYELILETLS